MPNPDFGQITNPAPDEMATVSTLADARAACLAYIEKHGLGGGNWRGGQVFDLTGNKIAYVSYNGRVWTGEEWPACPEIVLSQPADPPPTA